MGVELTDIFITLKPRDQLEPSAARRRSSPNGSDKTLRDMPGQRLAYSQPIEMRLNEMVSGVRVRRGGQTVRRRFQRAGHEGGRDRGRPQIDSRRRRRQRRADHRASRCCRSRSSRTRSPATACRPRRCSIWWNRSAASRWAKSSRGSCVFRWSCGLPEEHRGKVRRRSARILGADRLRRAIPAVAAGERRRDRRPLDDHARMGAAPAHGHGQRARPRPGQLRRGSRSKKSPKRSRCRPGRYRIECGGQFENLQRARTRLLIVVPMALRADLRRCFTRPTTTWSMLLRVFTGIPFAWVGGIFALWLRDMPFSISAAHRLHRHVGRRGPRRHDPRFAHPAASAEGTAAGRRGARRRPSTRLAARADDDAGGQPGLPADGFQHGMGAEVQRPLATVVIGGVIGAMVMSLLVLRVLYVVFNMPKTSRHEKVSALQASGESDSCPPIDRPDRDKWRSIPPRVADSRQSRRRGRRPF